MQSLLSSLEHIRPGSLFYGKYLVEQGVHRGLHTAMIFGHAKDDPSQEVRRCSTWCLDQERGQTNLEGEQEAIRNQQGDLKARSKVNSTGAGGSRGAAHGHGLRARQGRPLPRGSPQPLPPSNMLSWVLYGVLWTVSSQTDSSSNTH